MSTYPSTLQEPDPKNLYARKFRVICETHGIKTGAPEDLEDFLGKLESDRHFAMDFWSFAGKLSAREGGELSDEQMLALFVEGVTGRPMPSAVDPAMDPALALLRAMLAGVDVHRPEPAPPVAPARTTPIAPIDEARARIASIDEQRPKRFSAGLASMPPPAEPEPIPAPLPSQLQLALQSLEIVSRNLNEHITKIDQRLDGLEVKVKKQAVQPDLTVPIVRDTSQRPPDRSRLPMNPAVLHDEKRAIFESFPSQRDINWKKNVTLGVIILTTLAAGLTWKYYSPAIRETIAGFIQEDLETPSGSIWGRDTRPPALLPPIPMPAPASTLPQSSQSGSATPLQIPKLDLGPKESPGRAMPRTEQSIANLPGAVKVPSAEMEKRLVTSRVPIYPEDARVERVEGKVVAEAVISKYGAVTRVHVIAGDPRLIKAATEAIYQRRYRPYLLNGEPVDVTTTIAINFKLNG